jgi:hypothetical protein
MSPLPAIRRKSRAGHGLIATERSAQSTRCFTDLARWGGLQAERARGMQPCRAHKPEGVMGTIETSVDKTVSKVEGQIASWGAKLDELVAKADVAGRGARADARSHLDEMKTRLKIAQLKLAEAKAAGGDRWDTFKLGVESSWKELEGAFQKLTH